MESNEQPMPRRRQDEWTDNFFFSIVHDLKNMMVPIMSRAEMLQLEGLSEEKKHYLAKQIHNSCTSMTDALNKMVRICKDRNGMGEMNLEWFDLRLLVIEAMDVSEEFYEIKKLQVENAIPDKLSVYGDRESILMVISNLLGNAIKFTPSGGSIRITCELQGESICVRVADTGSGFDEKKMYELVEHNRYYTTPGTDGEQGTGFGLLLCVSQLQRNGTNLEYRNLAGGGAEFSFSLPVKQ